MIANRCKKDRKYHPKIPLVAFLAVEAKAWVQVLISVQGCSHS